MDDFILKMSGIVKEFPGVKALNNVELNVHPGTVHGLMGENGAGKSTLMKCLIGLYRRDAGTIYFAGKEVNFLSVSEAIKSGISMINQELCPIPERTVAENIWVGREPKKNILMVDHKRMCVQTRELLKKFDIKISPDTPLKYLTVAQMQMIEIIRAVSYESKIVIMDEPTSSLTQSEVAQLFKIIKNLKEQGISIIYITHKMDEVFQICDEVTVMRDGEYISTNNIKELEMDGLISKMVGREITQLFPKKECPIGDVILRVENISIDNFVHNVCFELHKGEILGFAGLIGAGRTETMEGIFGLRKLTEGNIYKNGDKIKIDCPGDAIKNKIGMLTEDRRGKGIVGVRNIYDNTVLSHLKAYGFPIAHKRILKDTDEYCTKLNVKTPNYKTQIQNLSGGNQQKVLVARLLLNDPDILIFDEPTRGVDVGAKVEIHSLITKLAAEGKGIILISSELPEVMGMADRIVVMHEGRITGVLNKDEFEQELIMRYATDWKDTVKQ
ncbi:Galactose/methyl galactoside import ATP-binding protein MglA [[Clostridium] hylemonae DSM 15053]|uniref:sugar ABC transporter ATP-binding protein n=1 Tax=[Clostridium] hylemonae TaxID=89153 RepID=UPI0002EBAD32|nr:sugar ABC transporter ATP-binding protein [[Clostridium] hylemonae]QEK17204.1 Galactose/methyl galactoside import ATP-binding protein MglA [[Clostridium] hylemonae DSM 15053]